MSRGSFGAARSWTDRATGKVIRGSFLLARQGTVFVEEPGGAVVRLPRTTLAPADQAFVARWEQKLQTLNGATSIQQHSAAPAPASPFAAVVVPSLACLALLLASGMLYGTRTGRRLHAGVAGAALLSAIGFAIPGKSETTASPAAAAAFEPFKKHVKTRWDARNLYVESDGLPEHSMMKGIRSWQQQVPLPQPYSGDNAWLIPLKPVLAEHPVSARTGLFRGAIALAVNGVPIFNALNNRGEDSFLAGELDEWGGHCGRADDYHYHIAPLHLQSQAGAGKPIAYGLDGYPLYGLTEPDGSAVGKLDELNGHFDKAGGYHYHGTKAYPYINGGMRGVVQVKGDQVDPQPRAAPVRPAYPPLRGAVITGFKTTGTEAYSLEFTWNGMTYTLNYRVEKDGRYIFDHVSPGGDKQTYTYRREQRREPPPGGMQ